MKKIEFDEKKAKQEKEAKSKLLEKETEKVVALAAFRNTAAYKVVMEIIDNEIKKSDVQNVIRKKGTVNLEAKTLEEIGKLTVIETMVAERLRNIKTKINKN